MTDVSDTCCSVVALSLRRTSSRYSFFTANILPPATLVVLTVRFVTDHASTINIDTICASYGAIFSSAGKILFKHMSMNNFLRRTRTAKFFSILNTTRACFSFVYIEQCCTENLHSLVSHTAQLRFFLTMTKLVQSGRLWLYGAGLVWLQCQWSIHRTPLRRVQPDTDHYVIVAFVEMAFLLVSSYSQAPAYVLRDCLRLLPVFLIFGRTRSLSAFFDDRVQYLLLSWDDFHLGGPRSSQCSLLGIIRSWSISWACFQSLPSCCSLNTLLSAVISDTLALFSGDVLCWALAGCNWNILA